MAQLFPVFVVPDGEPFGLDEVLPIVLKLFPADKFSPGLNDVSCWDHPDRCLLEARTRVTYEVLERQGAHMDQAIRDRLRKGVVNDLFVAVHNIVADWRDKAVAAHLACEELLSQTIHPKINEEPVTEDDDRLCIVCLEELRSVVYQPCRHRVCCESCAADLRTRSQLCPWCRGIVEAS